MVASVKCFNGNQAHVLNVNQHHTGEEVVSRWTSQCAEELNKVPLSDNLIDPDCFLDVIDFIDCRIVGPFDAHDELQAFNRHC